MKRAVFDAGVLVKLVLGEQDSPAALQAYHACDVVMAPDWAMLEVASALQKHAAQDDITHTEAREALQALEQLDLEYVPATSFVALGFGIALSAQHAVYDCLYVALAAAEHVPLVTADAGQEAVAVSVGVDVVRLGTQR
ncbi:MAG: type II toxin-antitoxin system VapC family toxin [Coriobacteriia bacterium]|nr:type II toxin-antitoxin system VapC family toxin [Coriobacteriia bacterium]